MKPAIFLLALLTVLALIKPTFGYSRIIRVELYAPFEGKVGEEIPLQADIYTGNNLVEYTHNVQATLLLPTGVELVFGDNPIFIGEMGPGPSYARCQWRVKFEEPGEYLLMVNATCVDTQKIPHWLNASTTIPVYAPPHVELEYTPTSNAYVNTTVTFNATKSYARGPNSTVTAYFWDFGDEANATTSGPIIEHKFLRIGNFTVSLNITDSKELSGMNTTEIAINLFGDLNCDGKINILDITIVAAAYSSKPGQSKWNPIADLNGDKVINIVDVSTVAREYGKTA